MKQMYDERRLIATFMGGVKEPDMNYEMYNIPERGIYDLIYLDYDCNWNLLMDVVDKIEKIKIGTYPVKFAFLRNSLGDCNIIVISCNALHFSYIRVENSSKIEAVYEAVIHFINWYNENI